MHEYIIPINEKEVLIKESEGTIIKTQKYTDIKTVLELENKSEMIKYKIEQKQEKLKKYRKITNRKFIPILLPIFILAALIAGPFKYLDFRIPTEQMLSNSFKYSLLIIPIGALGDIINYIQYKKIQKKEKITTIQLEILRKKQGKILNDIKTIQKNNKIEQIQPINLLTQKITRREKIEQLNKQKNLLTQHQNEEIKSLIKKI